MRIRGRERALEQHADAERDARKERDETRTLHTFPIDYLIRHLRDWEREE